MHGGNLTIEFTSIHFEFEEFSSTCACVCVCETETQVGTGDPEEQFVITSTVVRPFWDRHDQKSCNPSSLLLGRQT
jgi:hypothetical protein